jgi:hypothetical protein
MNPTDSNIYRKHHSDLPTTPSESNRGWNMTFSINMQSLQDWKDVWVWIGIYIFFIGVSKKYHSCLLSGAKVLPPRPADTPPRRGMTSDGEILHRMNFPPRRGGAKRRGDCIEQTDASGAEQKTLAELEFPILFIIPSKVHSIKCFSAFNRIKQP